MRPLLVTKREATTKFLEPVTHSTNGAFPLSLRLTMPLMEKEEAEWERPQAQHQTQAPALMAGRTAALMEVLEATPEATLEEIPAITTATVMATLVAKAARAVVKEAARAEARAEAKVVVRAAVRAKAAAKVKVVDVAAVVMAVGSIVNN